MTLQSLNAIVTTLQDAAQNQSTADELHHRRDPSPEILHFQEAVHILKLLPLSALSKLPAFTPPQPPTFP